MNTKQCEQPRGEATLAPVPEAHEQQELASASVEPPPSVSVQRTQEQGNSKNDLTIH